MKFLHQKTLELRKNSVIEVNGDLYSAVTPTRIYSPDKSIAVEGRWKKDSFQTVTETTIFYNGDFEIKPHPQYKHSVLVVKCD